MSLDEEKKEVVVATEEAPAKPNFLDYKIITQEMRDEFKEAFTLYDKDNDGFINLGHQNDLGLIMRALGEDPSEEEMTEMAKGFQTDGRLNYESFVAMMEDHIVFRFCSLFFSYYRKILIQLKTLPKFFVSLIRIKTELSPLLISNTLCKI